MAKRKRRSEDDWFEDDFDEDIKPKKRKRGRKKKKKAGKVIAWIVAFIVILAILLFIRFKYAAPSDEVDEELPHIDELAEEEEGLTAEEEEEAEPAPREVGPDVVEREELEKVSEVVDTTREPEIFSNVQCNFDNEAGLLYISLRVYNILDEEIKISPRGVMKGYNTYFLIRGIVDQDPGCGTEVVQPGEWTECKKIGFDAPRYGNVPGINRISVQVPTITEALLIECPEMPEVVEEEE
jgi:hypothetical protein